MTPLEDPDPDQVGSPADLEHVRRLLGDVEVPDDLLARWDEMVDRATVPDDLAFTADEGFGEPPPEGGEDPWGEPPGAVPAENSADPGSPDPAAEADLPDDGLADPEDDDL